jgi:hypothetical protein
LTRLLKTVHLKQLKIWMTFDMGALKDLNLDWNELCKTDEGRVQLAKTIVNAVKHSGKKGLMKSETGRIETFLYPWYLLPCDEVDFSYGMNWSYGQGGAPLRDEQWFIAYVDEELCTHKYVLPDPICKMMEYQRKFGADDAKLDIKKALGLL